eukprot:scaffold234437_cov71-Attheya_sp.AAC.3
MRFLHQYSISFLALSHACDDDQSAQSDAIPQAEAFTEAIAMEMCLYQSAKGVSGASDRKKEIPLHAIYWHPSRWSYLSN